MEWMEPNSCGGLFPLGICFLVPLIIVGFGKAQYVGDKSSFDA